MPDPSFVIPLFLQSAVIPFALTLATLAALRAMRKSDAAAAIALAIGFIGSYAAVLHAQWSFVPTQALDWLPWIALLAALVAPITEQAQRAGLRLLTRMAASCVAIGVIVWPGLEGIGMQKVALTMLVATLLISAAWTQLAQAAKSRPTPAFGLAIVAGGAALALMLDSSQSIGQLCGAVASVLAAWIGFNLLRLRAADSGAAAGAAVLLLGALLASAYLYAGFSLANVALLASALLADPIVECVNWMRHRSSGVVSWTATVILALIPVAATIGLAIRALHEAG